MQRVISDIGVYANCLIDELIGIKDRHRDILSGTEIDSINDICNLVSHNIGELKKP